MYMIKEQTMMKKICLFIFTLLTVWLMPFFSCNSAAGGELTGMINNPNDIGMVMYSKSSLGGEVVMTVMNDTPVVVISDQVEVEGYRWIQVRTQEGKEGWVFATGVTDSDGNILVPASKSVNQTTSGTYSGNKTSSGKTWSGSAGSYSNNYYANSANPSLPDNSTSTGGPLVWIYETGKKYHSHEGCSGSGDWQVTLQEAESLGRTPCLKCY